MSVGRTLPCCCHQHPSHTSMVPLWTQPQWDRIPSARSSQSEDKQAKQGRKQSKTDLMTFFRFHFLATAERKKNPSSPKTYFGNFLSSKVLLMTGEFKGASPAFFLWTTGYPSLSSFLTYKKLRIYLHQLKPSYWRLLKHIYNFQEIFFTVIYMPVTISYSSSFLPSSISTSPENQMKCNFHKKESSKEAHATILLQGENKKGKKKTSQQTNKQTNRRK